MGGRQAGKRRTRAIGKVLFFHLLPRKRGRGLIPTKGWKLAACHSNTRQNNKHAPARWTNGANVTGKNMGNKEQAITLRLYKRRRARIESRSIYPPETQLWSFCLCRGHSIWVNFSETSHVTVVSLSVLYRTHAWLHRDTKCLKVSPWQHPLLGL